ncbi:MAG: integral rane sensor signal transduction histidine kinase [Actinomycetia bacterium]|nr:integral rane sensor signal transduction histidine kinase [Actinomycetes bacterium]
MGRVRTTWLAWAMGVLSAALAAGAVALAGRNGESLAELVLNHHAIGIVTAIGLSVLGALIASRQPRNPIGWLMCLAALFLGVFSFTQQYAPLAVAESLPGVGLASWLATWTNLPGIAITITLVFLLFPDGRLPSRRWRPVAWLMAAATVVPAAVMAVRAWPVRGPALVSQSFEHPAVVDAFGIGFAVVLALSVVALAGLVVRFRRSTGTERQQIKWFAYGAMIGIPLGLPAEVPFWGPILELVQPPLMFAGLGIGMFRYRLYDIDRLLNRTLVYGLLTVSLAATYAAGVLLLGGRVSGGRTSSLVVAGVTLAVAAIFQPLRRTIQRAVDRRFNRRAYDAAATIEAFAVRLRQQVDPDALRDELLALVDQTVQPTRASLWLRPAGRSADAHS